ncbi:hypothetical protein HYY74_03295 [Candidatus Woesearchaeota archaeon]|nr:hypothetical protein [Candidatus Woesearchaeota archaeon]
MDNHTHKRKSPLMIAAFMSGTGTNLRRILELQHELGNELFEVAVIFTDTRDEKKCRAAEIAEEYSIPLVVNDMEEFYADRGQENTKDMTVREEYDLETAAELEKREVSVVALCGYMRLVTQAIYSNYVTLNVHPADLTKKDKDGRRIYAGLAGANCLKKAILNGEREVRSTVHIVNGELDGGPILAISPPLPVSAHLKGLGAEELNKAAEDMQAELKHKGDWIIYPEVIKMIAQGRMKIDDDEKVYVDGILMKEGFRFV